jgi:hypothetical protein
MAMTVDATALRRTHHNPRLPVRQRRHTATVIFLPHGTDTFSEDGGGPTTSRHMGAMNA